MSTRGRKAELQVIEGGLEEIPDELPDHVNPAMRTEWMAVVEDLRDRKMLTDAVLGTVDAYVTAMWNARKAQEAIDTLGLLIPAGKGILKQNPAVSLLGKSQSTIMRLAAELGLTPASRSRKNMQGDTPEEGGSYDLFNL